MGYCPYLCIVCKNVKDNGWWNKKHDCQQYFMVDMNNVNALFNLNIDLHKLIYPQYSSTPITYALCFHCYRKYRYTTEKLHGKYLKMYTKKKVNGKWIYNTHITNTINNN